MRGRRHECRGVLHTPGCCAQAYARMLRAGIRPDVARGRMPLYYAQAYARMLRPDVTPGCYAQAYARMLRTGVCPDVARGRMQYAPTFSIHSQFPCYSLAICQGNLHDVQTCAWDRYPLATLVYLRLLAEQLPADVEHLDHRYPLVGGDCGAALVGVDVERAFFRDLRREDVRCLRTDTKEETVTVIRVILELVGVGFQ